MQTKSIIEIDEKKRRSAQHNIFFCSLSRFVVLFQVENSSSEQVRQRSARWSLRMISNQLTIFCTLTASDRWVAFLSRDAPIYLIIREREKSHWTFDRFKLTVWLRSSCVFVDYYCYADQNEGHYSSRCKFVSETVHRLKSNWFFSFLSVIYSLRLIELSVYEYVERGESSHRRRHVQSRTITPKFAALASSLISVNNVPIINIVEATCVYVSER